jgi:dCMP deaminase
MPRPSWDEYFMAIAEQVSGRSTCVRRRCGAVLVKEKRILATGYNGVPAGLRHCEEVGCLREQLGIASGTHHELCRAIHAEQNAVVQAARHGSSIDGSIAYCTHQPCVLCAKILINAGIVEIVYRDSYPDPLSEEMLAEAGVESRRFDAAPLATVADEAVTRAAAPAEGQGR